MKQIQVVSQEQSNTILDGEIEQLKDELEQLTTKVNAFEATLRSHLSSEIIEVQELSVLYKAQKKAKKQKRLEQKKRGKNYVEPIGLKPTKRLTSAQIENAEDLKEKKRLYREAMLHIHPDKFALEDDKIDLATELTTRLVAIYNHEDLDALKAFHAHIFSQDTLQLKESFTRKDIKLAASPDAYLIREKQQLEEAIHALKSKHTYQVLVTYQDPMTFACELKAYYQDRIQKLRRRTRTRK